MLQGVEQTRPASATGRKSNQKKDFKNKRMSVLSPMNERIITKTYLNNT